MPLETRPTLPSLDESLERVRLGLENRARRVSGRVGETMASHVGHPGKMLRARFALHLGAALGVDPQKAEGVAKAMELVHNASLLHDDCVDEAEVRRGEPTPNALYSTTVALLLGDLAFSQALEEALEVSPRAVEHLVTTVREMTVGELQEEFLRSSLEVSLEAYMGIASRKTGALFEWCGHVLSALSPLEHAQSNPPRLGSAAGILLQIVDDIHDFTLEERVSGKQQGKDLALGRLTLPGVLAARDPKDSAKFKALWLATQKDPAAFAQVRDFLMKAGYIEATRNKGRELVRSILAWTRALPVKEEARRLEEFIDILAKREF